jgi:phospholipid/cholesterol/gamma-HCH transport system ATP-binding protein
MVGGRLSTDAAVDDFRIAFDGVDLELGGRQVFKGLTCGFGRGQITVVLGGSGAGKSTMLRLIGGLLRPGAGAVRVAGSDVTRLKERDLFRVRQNVGMLFQGGALLDSMSVFDNVALPLREHTGLSPDDIAAEVSRRLTAVGLPGTEALFPGELSGGMNRRAALARAVITDPEIVLCDEPFSGLDPLNVRRIESLLVELNRRLGITLVVTSHHLASSLRMADRIAFLVDGNAVMGTPQQLLANKDPRIADFLAAESAGVVDFDADARANALAGSDASSNSSNKTGGTP